MDEIVAALRAQQDELDGLVAGLDEAGLGTPSRCPGWSVADVLLHLAQTNEMAVASVQGRLAEYGAEAAAGLSPVGSVDEFAGAMVDKERGPVLDTLARWQASAAAQADAFASCAPSDRVEWVAGQLAARSLATTRLTETWIHTVDVADGLGVALPPTDRLRHVVRLAWRTLPYAFAQAGRELAGPVAFELKAPDGSTWTFAGDEPATTTITGEALDLCTVAGQRADASTTTLQGTGPDATPVLELVRTFA
jgi:uncharacterized protein (TIGR03084 family)